MISNIDKSTDSAVCNPHIFSLGSLNAYAHELASTLSWPLSTLPAFRKMDISLFPFEKYSSNPSNSLLVNAGADAIKYSDGVVQIAFEEGVVEHHYNIPRKYTIQSLSSSADASLDKLYSIYRERIAGATHRQEVWHFEHVSDGILLDVPDNTALSEEIVFDFTFSDSGRLYTPHVVIRAGSNSNLKCTVLLRGKDDATLCVDAMITVLAGEKSCVAVALVQQLPQGASGFLHTTVSAEKDSSVRLWEVHTGSKLFSTTTKASAKGEGSTIDSKGIYALKNQQVNMALEILHEGAATTSTTLYKGIVDGSGQSVFAGLINVAPDAKKTNAYLSNKNLLLSESARADSIPSLHIANNDVRCTHGSTSGKVNPEQLYYLQSRGIDYRGALALIVTGFFAEVLEGLGPYSTSHISNLLATYTGDVKHIESGDEYEF